MTEILTEGSKAPDFTLISDKYDETKLSGFRGKNVVLYFYPKDDTPGCTQEAKDFTCIKEQFDKIGAVVIGVSKDDAESHEHFRQMYQLEVTLLADPEMQAIPAYNVWVEKSMYGKKYMGIERSTFLIDKKGVIRKIWRKVKVSGHAEEVLEEAKKLG